MSDFLLNDKDIEEALLKTCILFEKREVVNKKDALFLKMITSLIMCGKANTIDDIKKYLENQAHNIEFDKSKIDATVKELISKHFIELEEDHLKLTPSTQKEALEYAQENSDRMENMVEGILKTVKQDYKSVIRNEEQVKRNIKDCLDYYFEVESLSFFDLDNPKKVDSLEHISRIASNNLGESANELSKIIVYAIGCMLQKPTEEESIVLETLSKLSITSRIMGQDPLLSNFKATILRNKSFILDTEIMLHLITNNARHSQQYKLLVKKLLDCQCRLYVPEEVISELYDHAEAADKRYQFLAELLSSDDPCAVDNLNNIFVEDYYYFIRTEEGKKTTWNNYIRNYFSKSSGVSTIYELLHESLDKRIFKGEMPPNIHIDENELNSLRKASYESTRFSAKALARDDEKNRQIADTDALIYLSARYLNTRKKGQNAVIKDNSILGQDCYILSTNTRIHQCAKTLGLSDQVLCKPNAILAYLAETGILSRNEVRMSSLFDNIFLLSMSNDIWPEISKLLEVGFDFRGVNYITLKRDLGEVLDDLLTKSSDDCAADIKAIKDKGYHFTPAIDSIVEENLESKRTIEQLQQQLEKLESELTKERKKTEDKKNRNSLEKYKLRISKKRKK